MIADPTPATIARGLTDKQRNQGNQSVITDKTHDLVEVPVARTSLLFPRNYVTIEIIGDHVTLAISTDADGLPAIIRRLEALQAMLALPPIPQPSHFPREMVAGDLAAHIEGGD